MFDLFRLHRDQHLLPMIDLAKVENHQPSHRDVNNKIDELINKQTDRMPCKLYNLIYT